MTNNIIKKIDKRFNFERHDDRFFIREYKRETKGELKKETEYAK